MKLRTGDFIAVVTVILLALGIWMFSLSCGARGDFVTVSRDGKTIYRVLLSESQEIVLPECTVEISENGVRVKNATCPDKVCEKSGTVKNAGEIIVCAPNRISVKISGDSKFDALVK